MKARASRGSGSDRQRSVGLTHSRWKTMAIGESGGAPSSAVVGGCTHSCATGPSSAKPTHSSPVSGAPGRSPKPVIVIVTSDPCLTVTACPGEVSDSGPSSTCFTSPSTAMSTEVIISLKASPWAWSRTNSSVVAPSTVIDSPMGSHLWPMRQAVDGSPSTAIAARASGRKAKGSP